MRKEFHYNYELNRQYITLYVNHQLSRKYVSRSNTWLNAATGPEMKIMTKIATTDGVINSQLNGDSELVAIDGNKAVIKTHLLCQKAQRRTLSMIVRRLQRLLAPHAPIRKVEWKPEVQKTAIPAPKLKPAEMSALELLKEAAKLFPNQDPVRLAAGLKDFNMPPQNILEVLRHLKEHFKDDNADMIRLAIGYNRLIEQYGSEWKDSLEKQEEKN